MSLKREIITTSDGSKTIQIKDWDEQYHSKHGAIQEAKHVFIKQGLTHYVNNLPLIEKETNKISILEIGFGTGLNAFITLIESLSYKLNINYVGIEAYPVCKGELEALNYSELISPKHSQLFKQLHTSNWNEPSIISSNFKLTKQKQLFFDISANNDFNIIYFDAFGPRVQPKLWTEVMFKKMYKALKNKGVLVTYSAKGSVRRAMQSVGFVVERLEGPPGKREMLRATKIEH